MAWKTILTLATLVCLALVGCGSEEDSSDGGRVDLTPPPQTDFGNFDRPYTDPNPPPNHL